MSLIEDVLQNLIGQTLAVIMTDGRKFRGKLAQFDSKIIILEDILELSDRLQWVRPVIHNSVVKDLTQGTDVVEQTDRKYLNKVLISTRHVIRIWPWEPVELE